MSERMVGSFASVSGLNIVPGAMASRPSKFVHGRLGPDRGRERGGRKGADHGRDELSVDAEHPARPARWSTDVMTSETDGRFRRWFWRPPRAHGEIIADRQVSV